MNQVKDFFEYIFNAFKIWVIIQPWQAGIKVRTGKKTTRLSPGIYFKIPYFDSVYVQETRLRVIDVTIQTLTTKDLQTITLSSAIGYMIENIEILYKTLYHPETTLSNIAMSSVADFVFKNDLIDITPDTIETHILGLLKETDYGLDITYFRLTNFAVVKTFRLIQDQSWNTEQLKMNDKK